MDQLEWGDNLLRNAPRGKFYNPAGILITLAKDNVIPPETVETSRKRKLREAAHQDREQGQRELARMGWEVDAGGEQEVRTSGFHQGEVRLQGRAYKS